MIYNFQKIQKIEFNNKDILQITTSIFKFQFQTKSFPRILNYLHLSIKYQQKILTFKIRNNSQQYPTNISNHIPISDKIYKMKPLTSSSNQLVTQQQQMAKLQRHIQNLNKQVIKSNQFKHSANLKIQTILGIQNSCCIKNNQQQTINNTTQTTPPLNSNSQQQSRNGNNLLSPHNLGSNQTSLKSTHKNLFNNSKSSVSSHLKLQNHSNYPLISLNQQQILYYSCKYFIIYNISSKQYQMICKDIKGYQLMQMKKFNLVDNQKKMIACIYQPQILINTNSNSNNSNNSNNTSGNNSQNIILTLLTIKTDYQSRTSRSDSRYQWKVIKLYNNNNPNNACHFNNTINNFSLSNNSNANSSSTLPFNTITSIESYCYNSKKNYLYFIITKSTSNNVITATSLTSCPSSASNNIMTQHQHIPTASSFNSNSGNSIKTIQFIWIYDLNKQLLLINQEIRSNTVGFYIQYLVIENNCNNANSSNNGNENVIYLMGKNYFRQWQINFNQRSMKESNVRNIQRVLKNKCIIDVQQIERYGLKSSENHQFPNQKYNLSNSSNNKYNSSNIKNNLLNNNINNVHTLSTNLSNSINDIHQLNPHVMHNPHLLTQASKLVLILTSNELLLVKNNELISIIKPQRNLLKHAKNKDNIEKQLQNSFNQIYKMKFLFDQYQELKTKQHFTNKHQSNQDTILMNKQQKNIQFTSISKCWKSQNQNYYFAISTNSYNVLIYQLVDFQIKLDTQYNYSKQMVSTQFKSIIPIQNGDLLLIMTQNKQIHLINQENYNNIDDQLPIKSLWGNGQIHSGMIYSLTSPMLQNIMCTVGEDGTFKLWSMKKNQRSILFEQKPNSQPLGITIHPCGTMIGVNFQREIKIFSILPKQFYQITSIKTNYTSLQLKYSEKGEFLVSNQGNVLIFYEPFSLKTLGYIQPADLKCNIIDFKISTNAEYICFITQELDTYLQPIDIGQLQKWQHFSPAHHQCEMYTAFYFDFFNYSNNAANQNNGNTLLSKQNSILLNKEKQIQKSSNTTGDQKTTKNRFIGATKSKYLVLYDDYGSKLITQFPILDCYIVDMQVCDSLLFAATSKGTIRVYSWPILQEDLQLDIVNLQEKQIRYKPPIFDEYQVWNESIPIKKIHKLKFSNQLVVVNDSGNMAIFSYQQTKNKKLIYQQISPDRKKMEQLINQMFYIKKSQAEKRNKLIEKTQNDILKVENQILRQKISLQRKMQEEQFSVEKGFEIKNQIQQTQKKQYIIKEQEQISVLKKQIQQKQKNLQKLKSFIVEDYQGKKIYQKQRNQNVSVQIKDIILKHKQKISKKMQEHKQDVRNKKKQYYLKVKQIQKQFQEQIIKGYEKKIQEDSVRNDEQNINSGINKNRQSESMKGNNINNFIKKLQSTQSLFSFSNATSTNKQDQSGQALSQLKKQQITSSNKLKRMNIYTIKQRDFIQKKQKELNDEKQANQQAVKQNRKKLIQHQFNRQIIQQFTSKQNQQIVIQSCRVEQLQKGNETLSKSIQQFKKKVGQMQHEDQLLQKDFQKNLEDYNFSRFQNLNLHSQVLKMQNQLIERKQVLDNKEEIVMLAYQEKQKLQNYKELVKGSLTKLHQKKENIRDVFFKKENDLNVIFSELVNEIHKMENKRGMLQRLQGKINLSQKQNDQTQSKLNQVIEKLKQIKKFLLLERMNQEKSQKSVYQYEQSILNTINFLKKRLFMESIKQKKNKQLKKSALGQILKQNKNLLEECNQLRSQGIQYENEIKNLSNKLKEANKMISIETKLKSQKNQVNEQKNQLDIIKELFKMHLNQFDVHDEQEEGNTTKNGQNNESQVYYDSQNQKKQLQRKTYHNHKVVYNSTKTFHEQDQDRGYTQYKPFKLSGYIEAQPFEKIQL